jgi:hypothetical protein
VISMLLRKAAKSRGSVSMLAWISIASCGLADFSRRKPRLSGRARPGLMDQTFSTACRRVTSER